MTYKKKLIEVALRQPHFHRRRHPNGSIYFERRILELTNCSGMK